MQKSQTLVCPHRVVQLALHWHSVDMQLNEVDRNASMLQAHNVHTHAHTHSHIHTHAHTYTHAHTCTGAHTYTGAHTHTYTLTHTYTHSSYSTQAARKASTRMQQQ